ncbi:MAG: hypothetical protein OXB84_06020, partial [Halobacteriovoraceae bacterium]|nr:hypothetical protein [Halobacteriovoraceae bacterium]
MSKKNQEAGLHQEIYSNVSPSRLRFLILGVTGIIVGFFINFPIIHTAKVMGSLLISPLKSCPIEYENTNVGFFMPKIHFISPRIDGSCLGMKGTTFSLDRATMGFRGISFIPLGLIFHGQIKNQNTTINIYPSISFFSHSLKIKQTQIDAASLIEFLGQEFVKGVFN